MTFEGAILVLKRSSLVGSYQGKGAAVSGYLEGDEPSHRAMVEISEELGLENDAVSLRAAGAPLLVEETDHTWVVHPFRFELLDKTGLRLDWEHVELRWISPDMLSSMDTVPGLEEAWNRVAP